MLDDEKDEKEPKEPAQEIPPVVDKVETAIEKADDAADKAVEKISVEIDKVAEILLDPDTTGAEKKALLDSLEGVTPKLMEVTDKWFALESELGQLKSAAFSGLPKEPEAAQSGEPAASSSSPALQAEDQTPPAEIPVPEAAAVEPKAENPVAAFLRRIW